MKKARLKDIAERVGVSVATVSYVLNNSSVPISAATRARVLQAAEELHYTTNWNAKGLKVEHYNAVGVIVEDIRSFYVNELIDGICQYAEENGVRVMLCNLRADDKSHTLSHEDLDHFSEQLTNLVYSTFGKQLDCLIYVAAFYRDVSRVFIPDGHRVSYAYSYCGGSDSLSVAYDDEQGAALAVEHLIEMGHERIGFINCLEDTEPGAARTRAYYRVMKQAGLNVHPDWVQHTSMFSKSVYEAARSLLSAPERPTALFVNADSVCHSVYRACWEAGLRIPEDVSVVGFDNSDFDAYMNPALSSIAFPSRDIGYTVMKCACEEPERRGSIRLDCCLVQRGSVQDRREDCQ